jgi:hypothetical protein
LPNDVEGNFHTNLTYGWFDCFLERGADFVKETIVAPSELPRFQVPRQHLNQYIGLIKN